MGAYFDNAATTRLDPRVAEAMQPYLAGLFGNPSSLHGAGREVRAAVDRARSQVAALIGSDAGEIVFTGSGTEADNLALVGAFESDSARRHFVASAIEHPAVLRTLAYLESRGASVSLVDPGPDGIVAVSDVARVIRPDTRLVSVMAANNVLGTLQPIGELAALCRGRGVLFHTDAVQAAGKLPIDVKAAPIDLLSLSAHKLHGPQGVGGLFVRGGLRLSPLVHGGGQERGLRSATENVAGLVGFGRAAELARMLGAEEGTRIVRLRERLLDGLRARVPHARLLGHRFRRLPGHLCLTLDGQEGEAMRLLLALDEAGFAVSTGSACSAGHASEPSYVLLATGLDPVRARGSLRITLGRFNSEAEIDAFLSVFPNVVERLRPVMSRPCRAGSPETEGEAA